MSIVGSASLFIGVWTKSGQLIDAAVLEALLKALPASVRGPLADLGRRIIPLALAPASALLVLHRLVRASWREPLAVLVSTAAVPLTMWLRDQALERPHFGVPGYDHNTFPSTHATIGFLLVTATALLWPRRGSGLPAPPVLYVAASLAVVVALGNVVWWDHRPVDVVGSFALTEVLVLTTLAVFARRPPEEDAQSDSTTSSP